MDPKQWKYNKTFDNKKYRIYKVYTTEKKLKEGIKTAKKTNPKIKYKAAYSAKPKRKGYAKGNKGRFAIYRRMKK